MFQVSAGGEAPHKWTGEIFFHLDIVPACGPVRTHTVSVRRILGNPRVNVRDKLKVLKKMFS